MTIAVALGVAYVSPLLAQTTEDRGWVIVRDPTEWLDQPSRPYPAKLKQRLRVYGEARHPRGIEQIIVSGVLANVEPTANPGVFRFLAHVEAALGMATVEVTVRPPAGDDLVVRYPIEVEVPFDSSYFSKKWIGPDSVRLFIGNADTIKVGVEGSPEDVVPNEHLDWRSGNPAVAVVGQPGVIHPVGVGSALITATGFDREVAVRVDVHAAPTLVEFSDPAASVLNLTVGDEQQVRADVQLSGGGRLRGVIPKMSLTDTLIARISADGVVHAVRPGSVTLKAAVAGVSQEWPVLISSPRVTIRPDRFAVLLGDSVYLRGQRARPDGTVLPGPIGSGITWRTSDPEVLAINGTTGHARRVGRAEVEASHLDAADAETFFTIGDLVAGVVVAGKSRIATISFNSSDAVLLGGEDVVGESPALSPDGRTIAFVRHVGGARSIYLMDTDGQNLRQLMPGQRGQELGPQWSHDGQQVVFVSNRAGNYEVFSAPVGTSAAATRLTRNNVTDNYVSTAPDRAFIAFERYDHSVYEVVVSNLDGTNETEIDLERRQQLKDIHRRKPVLLQGAREIIYALRTGDEHEGEALGVIDLVTKTHLRALVPALRNRELVYAAAPDGARVAYHQRALRGERNMVIHQIDLQGNVLATIALQNVDEIRSLNWAAMPFTYRKGHP